MESLNTVSTLPKRITNMTTHERFTKSLQPEEKEENDQYDH